MNNKELCIKYRETGDLKIKGQIIENNKAFVKSIISKRFNYPNIFEDLFQEGMIALSNCIEKYEPSKSELTTFSYYSIRNRLLNYLRKNQQTTSVTYEGLSELIEAPRTINVFNIVEEACSRVSQSTKENFYQYITNFPIITQKQRGSAKEIKQLIME